MLDKDALALAQNIAHDVWQKYDDTHGYRTEKQMYNANVSPGVPDNIWFFWGQFDSTNQEEFFARVCTSNDPGTPMLKVWCMEQINMGRAASASIKARFDIDL